MSRELLWAPMEQIVAFGLPTLLTLHKASKDTVFIPKISTYSQLVTSFTVMKSLSKSTERSVTRPLGKYMVSLRTHLKDLGHAPPSGGDGKGMPALQTYLPEASEVDEALLQPLYWWEM